MGSIPRLVLEALARHCPDGRPGEGRLGLMIRHAERFPVYDLATHESVLLTEQGMKDAARAGAELFQGALGARGLRVRHSPVERCAQTARGLVEGFREGGGAARLEGPEALLASPYVKDRHRAYALVNGFGHAFIRAWFDGEVPEDCFARRHHAAQEQLSVVVRALSSCEEGGACALVTHDWNIALVREEFLGLRHEDVGWPDFLDGVVVVERAGRVVLAVGDRDVEIDPADLA